MLYWELLESQRDDRCIEIQIWKDVKPQRGDRYIAATNTLDGNLCCFRRNNAYFYIER